MNPDETEAFATRLPVAEAEQLWNAVEETGLSRSALLARAVSHYLDENPDDLPSLRSDRPSTGPLVSLGILPSETERSLRDIEER